MHQTQCFEESSELLNDYFFDFCTGKSCVLRNVINVENRVSHFSIELLIIIFYSHNTLSTTSVTWSPDVPSGTFFVFTQLTNIKEELIDILGRRISNVSCVK